MTNASAKEDDDPNPFIGTTHLPIVVFLAKYPSTNQKKKKKTKLTEILARPH